MPAEQSNSCTQSFGESIPAEVLHSTLHYLFTHEESQGSTELQVLACRLLCTSKSLRAAVCHQCVAVLPITCVAKRRSKALLFARWLRKHVGMVKAMDVQLPEFEQDVDTAIAAALNPAAARDGEPGKALAATAAATLDMPTARLQSYTCNSR